MLRLTFYSHLRYPDSYGANVITWIGRLSAIFFDRACARFDRWFLVGAHKTLLKQGPKQNQEIVQGYVKRAFMIVIS